MAKHEATSPPATATAVVDAVAPKSTAKTLVKAKGWKKWKRRLSRVFTGKKKPKVGKGSPLLTTRDPTRPLDLRDPRAPKERTDGSTTGSHKGDRQSTESRVWGREPGSHEPGSTESRSEKEPTDEEWEAEQRRLAYQEEYDYEEDEGEPLDEVEYAEEAEAGDQEDTDMVPRAEADEEQEEELAEDVFEYEESYAELSQSEGQVEMGVYEGDQVAGTEGYVPEEEEEGEYLPEEEDEGECEEPHGTPLDMVYDGSSEDTEVEVDSQSEEHGKVTSPVADLTLGDACSGYEGYGDEPANDPDWQAELQEEAAVLSESEDATVVALDCNNEEDWTPEGDEDGVTVEDLSDCDAEDNPEESPIALSFAIDTCVATPPCLSKDPHYPSSMSSSLESIPPHMPLQLHAIAAWCCDPNTPTTADSRLLLASLTHAKWTLAQLIAEKLQRDYPPCSSSAASTEILLEAMLAA